MSKLQTWYQRNKEISKARANAYYANNKDRVTARQKKKWAEDREHMRSIKVKCVYGLSKEEHEALCIAHGGKCAICQKEARLNIDHDHKTGRVRGLLCAKCNKAIGLLEDDPVRSSMAAKYLQERK